MLAHLLPVFGAISVASSVSGSFQHIFQYSDQDIDIVTGSDFNGLSTFANLPYLNCFREGNEEVDIAILGAPFDTVS